MSQRAATGQGKIIVGGHAVTPGEVVAGKLWAGPLPLALPLVIVVPVLTLYCCLTPRFTKFELLAYLGWMLSHLLLGVYGPATLSCLCTKVRNAVAAGYLLVWVIGPGLWVLGTAIIAWQSLGGIENERVLLSAIIAT